MPKRDDSLKDFVLLMLKLFGAFGVAVIYLALMMALLARVPVLGVVVIAASLAALVAWLKKR